MPSVQIQFHVDPGEALHMAAGLAREHALLLVAEGFFPEYRAIQWQTDEPPPTEPGLEGVRRVALRREPPDLTATTAHEFTGRNPGSLYLSIGDRGEHGLRESALDGMTDDQELLRLWRRVIRKAKSEMHRGATVRNPHSGATLEVPSHLHTPGAHALAARGVKMLAAAGWTEFDFHDCSRLA